MSTTQLIETTISEEVGPDGLRVLALIADAAPPDGPFADLRRIAAAREHRYSQGSDQTFWVIGLTGHAMRAADLPFINAFALDGEEHARKALRLIEILYGRVGAAS